MCINSNILPVVNTCHFDFIWFVLLCA